MPVRIRRVNESGRANVAAKSANKTRGARIGIGPLRAPRIKSNRGHHGTASPVPNPNNVRRIRESKRASTRSGRRLASSAANRIPHNAAIKAMRFGHVSQANHVDQLVAMS